MGGEEELREGDSFVRGEKMRTLLLRKRGVGVLSVLEKKDNSKEKTHDRGIIFAPREITFGFGIAVWYLSY